MTWGQGLYFEKWKKDGVDVPKWLKIYGETHMYPHEALDYESHLYREQHHFPGLVSRHYDRHYETRWGNGGSNWDIIHLSNLIPALSPQYRNGGAELVVVQLTDWSRTDNRILYNNDIYEQTPIPNIDYLMKDRDWESKLVDKMFENEAFYQIKKIKQTLDELGIKWIVISWRDDLGEIIKENFSENYVPFYYKGKEYSGFEICLQDDEYSLEKEFYDGHLNSKGCQLVADSIIKKIESMGGRSLFNYISPKNQNVI